MDAPQEEFVPYPREPMAASIRVGFFELWAETTRLFCAQWRFWSGMTVASLLVYGFTFALSELTLPLFGLGTLFSEPRVSAYGAAWVLVETAASLPWILILFSFWSAIDAVAARQIRSGEVRQSDLKAILPVYWRNVALALIITAVANGIVLCLDLWLPRLAWLDYRHLYFIADLILLPLNFTTFFIVVYRYRVVYAVDASIMLFVKNPVTLLAFFGVLLVLYDVALETYFAHVLLTVPYSLATGTVVMRAKAMAPDAVTTPELYSPGGPATRRQRG